VKHIPAPKAKPQVGEIEKL